VRQSLRAGRGGPSDGDGSNGKPPSRPAAKGSPSAGQQPSPRRPRLKKLRMALVLLGLSLLAFVSWIFGIMMAVAQDLPQLENRAQFQNAENSVVYDVDGDKLAVLTGNEQRILVDDHEISPTVKQAVVAIEDQRFYEHRGIDFFGIGRAVYQDILAGGAVQGGSTITQQFVKNALAAQNSRTIFQKLREAALAYHLERQWSKEKIMTEYLNSIYFGEGAYGIESAARTYFGWAHPGCGNEEDRCAAQLLPHEAAVLAGLISSPDAYNPRTNQEAAEARRNLVLQKMLEQGVIDQEQYDTSIQEPIPKPSQITPPKEDSEAPYFTSWLRQQVVDRYGAGEAFGGGLEIYSTLDLELQRAVEDIVSTKLAAIEPTASVVVMDNDTAAVRAMVGGPDYDKSPFNLATNGHRQPGSAWKPFTLVTALEEGHSLSETYTSEQKSFSFHVPGINKPQQFVVNNYEDTYRGVITLLDATTYSDNSVYAELGIDVGTEDIARTAQAMGIQTKLSTNPAMILGGLETGVTPLEMTHAYVTLAHDGERVSGTMASSPGGPVAIDRVEDGSGDPVKTNDGESGENEVETEQVVTDTTADTAKSALETVVDSGTGVNAAYGGYAWGKTGTTDENGDAWFCGATPDITACVWVGHPESTKPMETEYAGGPVDGGTYPAEIWQEVVLAYEQLEDERKADQDAEIDPDTGTVPLAPAPPTTTPAPVAPVPEEVAPVPEEPVAPAPAPEAPAAPAPTPAAPPAPEGGTAPAPEGGTAVGGTG
jgi:penicillin-binding protein 1A